MPNKTRVEIFRDWIASSAPGQVYTYYIGFLAVDRGDIVDVSDGEFVIKANGDIDELGNVALDAFREKRIHLFQRKVHDKVYEYIAMKRNPYGRLW